MSGLSNPFCASLSQMVRVRTLFAALAFLIFVSATQTIVAQTTLTFSNPAPITINDTDPATPYPSNITVAGFAAGQTITKVTVTLTGFSHTFPADVGVLLVSPAGTSVNLTARCGGVGPGVTNSNLTFDDAAATNVPDQLVTGTYKPTQCGATAYSAPAPAAPYGTSLAAVNGGTPNGVWKLFVQDFFLEDVGSISGGYSLTITAAPTTAASVSVGGRVMTASGRGIRNVSVALTDSNRNTRMAVSTSFGYYRFEDVAAGETYIISARGKRYTFIQPTQVLNINEDTEDVNFIANSIER